MKEGGRGFSLTRAIGDIDYAISEGIDQDFKANSIAEAAAIVGAAKGAHEFIIANNVTDGAICLAAAVWLFTVLGTNSYLKGRELMRNRRNPSKP